MFFLHERSSITASKWSNPRNPFVSVVLQRTYPKVPKVRHLSNPARKCGVWNTQATLIAAWDMPALMLCLACRERVE